MQQIENKLSKTAKDTNRHDAYKLNFLTFPMINWFKITQYKLQIT